MCEPGMWYNYTACLHEQSTCAAQSRTFYPEKHILFDRFPKPIGSKLPTEPSSRLFLSVVLLPTTAASTHCRLVTQ